MGPTPRSSRHCSPINAALSPSAALRDESTGNISTASAHSRRKINKCPMNANCASRQGNKMNGGYHEHAGYNGNVRRGLQFLLAITSLSRTRPHLLLQSPCPRTSLIMLSPSLGVSPPTLPSPNPHDPNRPPSKKLHADNSTLHFHQPSLV